jgi:hypothetical protein
LLNKKLKSPFNIKEKLNKEKPLFNYFSFLKVLFNTIKRGLIIIADKKLIHG